MNNLSSSLHQRFVSCDFNWTATSGEWAVVDEPLPQALAYILCLLSGVGYGCMLVPFKFVKTGDGIFSNWVLCTVIFSVSLLVQVIRGQTDFYPLATLSGVLWAMGNWLLILASGLIGISASWVSQ